MLTPAAARRLNGSGAGAKQPAPESPNRLLLDFVGDQQQPWDVFVRACPDSSFCHLWRWRDVMSDALGHECLNLVALDRDGAWRGILPLVHVRSAVFGRYLISMPFLNAGGPAGSREARALLASWAVEESRRRGVELLELRTRAGPEPGLRASRRKITVALELPPAPEPLWGSFPAKLRAQVRRPSKAGCEAQFGPEQLDAFYHVFARHMRDLGTPVLPMAFFQAIAASFPDLVLFGTIRRRAEPVAAGCGLLWGDAFELVWAAALREHHADAPNMLLYWRFMEQAIARGAKWFDFGRCSPGSGTHRFKQQWGGHDIALPWSQWSPSGRTAPPTPDRGPYRLATAVWRRLPLSVTNTLGPRLARGLP